MVLFMKSHDDYKNSIEQKADGIIRKRKRLNRTIASVTSIAACIALIICAFTLMPDLIGGNPGVGTDLTSASQSDNPNLAPVINMNAVAGIDRASRLYFDPEKTYTETWDWGRITAYFGKDITPDYITAGLKPDPQLAAQEVILNNDGTVAYDAIWLNYFTFYYEDGSQSTGGDSTGISIIASKAGYSRDCIIMWPEDMKESLLNGVSVKFGHNEMGWGGTYETPYSYYDLFIAEFTKDGISFQVTSSNISEEEFVKMVDSLTQK